MLYLATLDPSSCSITLCKYIKIQNFIQIQNKYCLARRAIKPQLDEIHGIKGSCYRLFQRLVLRLTTYLVPNPFMFTQHAPTHIHCEERNNHISSLSDIKPTDVTINYKLSKFLIEFENGTWHFIISLSYLTCLNLLPAIVGRHLFPSSCMSSCQFVSIFLIFTLPKTLLCYQIFLDVGKRTGRGTVFSLGSMHSS